MSERRRRLVVVAVVAVTVVVAGAAFAAAQFASPTTAGGGLAASVSSSTAGSTSTTGATHATTTSTVVRQLSPAWIEGQPFLDPDTFLAPGGLRRAVDRYRENPNQWSTPMGALCWGSFEMIRAFAMRGARDTLDLWLVPDLVERLGLGDDLLSGGLGPATSRRVIDAVEALVSPPATTTTAATSSTSATSSTTSMAAGGPYSGIDSELVEFLRVLDYGGGTGLEWLNAMDVLAGEEWAAAVRADDSLPAPALRFADMLAAFAREQAGMGVPDYVLVVETFDKPDADIAAFVELAKYDPNCLRASLGGPAEFEPLDIPDPPRPGTTTTTLRSGSVRVRGADLNGVLIPREAGLGVGYSRSARVGLLDDTTFTHDGVGYEVERLLWWPNGTIRLDVYPGGLDAAVGDDAWLVITPLVDPATEHVWRTGDAQHLGSGADFVWDTTFTPDAQALYRVELRIGVPGVPQNVDLSEALITWDAPSGGPAVGTYYVWVRSTLADGTGESFYNVPTLDAERFYDITNVAPLFGEEFIVQVRSHNSAGYSPWTPPQTFATPASSTTSTTVGSSTTSTTAA